MSLADAAKTLFPRTYALLVFAGVLAVLLFYPKSDDPVRMAAVHRAAQGVVPDEFLVAQREAGGTRLPDDVRGWHDVSRTLSKRFTSLGQSGAHEPACMGGLLESYRDLRDRKVAADGPRAYLDNAKTIVRGCADGQSQVTV